MKTTSGNFEDDETMKSQPISPTGIKGHLKFESDIMLEMKLCEVQSHIRMQARREISYHSTSQIIQKQWGDYHSTNLCKLCSLYFHTYVMICITPSDCSHVVLKLCR